jgi:hypothetical protein
MDEFVIAANPKVEKTAEPSAKKAESTEKVA